MKLFVGQILHIVLDTENPEKICYAAMVVSQPLGSAPLVTLFTDGIGSLFGTMRLAETARVAWHDAATCPEDKGCTCGGRPHGSSCPKRRW